LPHGRAAEARDAYNGLRVELEEPGFLARRLTIEARAFNNAVAFRYLVPDSGAARDFRLAREATEFRLPNDATSYALVLPHYRSMYESEFLKLPLSAFSNQGGVASSALLGLPLLLELPGTAWLAIAEADVRDTAAMYLTNPSGSWTGHWVESRLSPDPDDPDLAVTGTLPYRSAWRVVMIADHPGRFIESTVLTSLNPPSKIDDTSWIKPGRAAWDWWSGSIGADGEPAFTTATRKHFVDFAARSGFEYMLVDAGWSDRNDITKMNGRVDIPELVRYAGAKNVRVWIWAHWAQLERQMDEAFAMYEKWGVAGVKIDFMSRDDHRMMRFYHRTAATAARHRIMVDFHGSTNPSGLQRTWPNILGYESVLGMEQSKAGARDNPESHVMLPFTRMIGGLMDYTPGGFNNVTREQFGPLMRKPMVLGTRAHQLAMYVVFEAPFQMVADHPDAYKDQPAFQFIKDAPSTWDETRMLDGRPGEYVFIARRRGSEWFVGAMTNWTPRVLDIPLAFLGAGAWTAEVYADGEDAAERPKNVSITKQKVGAATVLKAALAPGGGYAVRLVPAERRPFPTESNGRLSRVAQSRGTGARPLQPTRPGLAAAGKSTH
jgi:alpha-glucosidase